RLPHRASHRLQRPRGARPLPVRARSQTLHRGMLAGLGARARDRLDLLELKLSHENASREPSDGSAPSFGDTGTTRAMYFRMLRRAVAETDKRLLWKLFWTMGVHGARSVIRHKRRLRRGEWFPPFRYVSIINSCNLRCQGCWVDVAHDR